MPTSRHCCHNLYLAQHYTLQLHIDCPYMMQVNIVQVPHICNTVLYHTRHATKAISSTYSYAPSFPDTPSSVQLLLLSTLIVQKNMSSHTAPAHIQPKMIPSHMQPGIHHQTHPPTNVTSCLLYCIPINIDNNNTILQLRLQVQSYDAPSFRAISLRSSTRALH